MQQYLGKTKNFYCVLYMAGTPGNIVYLRKTLHFGTPSGEWIILYLCMYACMYVNSMYTNNTTWIPVNVKYMYICTSWVLCQFCAKIRHVSSGRQMKIYCKHVLFIFSIVLAVSTWRFIAVSLHLKTYLYIYKYKSLMLSRAPQQNENKITYPLKFLLFRIYVQ